MSVILDALKKLDRERSSRQSGPADIAAEILKPDLPRPGTKIPLYAAVAFFTAVATVGITYSVMVKRSSPAKSSAPVAMSSPAPQQPADAVLLSREPVPEPPDELSPVPPKVQVPLKTKEPPASLTEDKSEKKKTNQNVISKEVKKLKETESTPRETKISPEQVPAGPAATPPSLNISAIVWYEEPARRFAMINGTIATEGSVIEGMKVEEIYPTRVRFLHNGQHFEISIK
jgi:general secretion pathway protein B